MIGVRSRNAGLSPAQAWSRASLEQGSALAEFVSQRLPTATSAFAIVSDADMTPVLDDHSRSIDHHVVDHLLGEHLHHQASTGAAVLVVEDDLAREGDPGLADVVFVEDRVIRWRELQREPSQLVRLIRRGASGYPLNAYVCDEAARTILRRADRSLTVEGAASLASTVRAVIHSIYDAESYLVISLGMPTRRNTSSEPRR
ncbi:hypothetical protein [Microbacterium natoriense]|uniref:hypothetical protein n=1 Tax=Microbacterium natoriense TaxID=284570 RepID=UPI0031D762BC